ncbi:MAG: ferrous iron transport protein A [Tepidisphaerales bacterium]
MHRLPVGGRARVVAVRGEPEVRRRLLEMGLCRGVEVVCRRRAWWGDPIEFDVRGYRLALRAALAGEVTVCPMDAGV